MREKKHKRKIARKLSLFPRDCRRARQLSHGLCPLSHSAQAQGTHGKPVAQQAPAQHPCGLPGRDSHSQESPTEGGIPRAGPLGTLRGSIRQTLVIDGHGTPAWEERTPSGGRKRAMERGPPAGGVTSAVILRARAQQ